MCFLVVLYFSNASIATATSHSRVVNILTWLGYLNYPAIVKEAENECDVKISFDEYYSNDEFLRRWQGQDDYYDIMIFSDTIYNVIRNKIPNFKESLLWNQSLFYNSSIKAHYDKLKYPHNVIYFAHSLSGFLWNPKNITLSSGDSIATIFKKANKKYVAMLDDPIEMEVLMEANFIKKTQQENRKEGITISNFKKMIQDANVYVANDYSQIFNKPEFTFSYGWIGEALVDLGKSNKDYQFLIHPKLSYISSDLIAQTTNKKTALCVVKFLTSKKTMSLIQQRYFYFSPYADYSSIENAMFKNIYKNFLIALPSLTWIDSFDKKGFRQINRSWQLIKLSLNNLSNERSRITKASLSPIYKQANLKTLTMRDHMKTTNKIIFQYYDSFNKRDLIKFMDILHDKIVHDINLGESQIGKENFSTFMKHMNYCYQEKIKNLVIMSSADGLHAAAEFIVEGTYIATDSGLPPASGQHYSLLGGAFFEIKDGKIFRITNYYNLNDWLKQIGK